MLKAIREFIPRLVLPIKWIRWAQQHVSFFAAKGLWKRAVLGAWASSSSRNKTNLRDGRGEKEGAMSLPSELHTEVELLIDAAANPGRLHLSLSTVL